MRELNAGLITCLNQGAPERRSLQLRCTLGAIRRKIREVGRGLSLADTQTGR